MTAPDPIPSALGQMTFDFFDERGAVVAVRSHRYIVFGRRDQARSDRVTEIGVMLRSEVERALEAQNIMLELPGFMLLEVRPEFRDELIKFAALPAEAATATEAGRSVPDRWSFFDLSDLEGDPTQLELAARRILTPSTILEAISLLPGGGLRRSGPDGAALPLLDAYDLKALSKAEDLSDVHDTCAYGSFMGRHQEIRDWFRSLIPVAKAPVTAQALPAGLNANDLRAHLEALEQQERSANFAQQEQARDYLEYLSAQRRRVQEELNAREQGLGAVMYAQGLSTTLHRAVLQELAGSPSRDTQATLQAIRMLIAQGHLILKE